MQLWTEGGKSSAITEDAERFQLFEFSRNHFVYTAKEDSVLELLKPVGPGTNPAMGEIWNP